MLPRAPGLALEHILCRTTESVATLFIILLFVGGGDGGAGKALDRIVSAQHRTRIHEYQGGGRGGGGEIALLIPALSL